MDTDGHGGGREHRENKPQRHKDTENLCVSVSPWLIYPLRAHACSVNSVGGRIMIMKKALMSACNPVFWALVAFASPASAQTAGQLIPHNVKLESADYLGKRAVKITEDGQVANGEA